MKKPSHVILAAICGPMFFSFLLPARADYYHGYDNQQSSPRKTGIRKRIIDNSNGEYFIYNPYKVTDFDYYDDTPPPSGFDDMGIGERSTPPGNPIRATYPFNIGLCPAIQLIGVEDDVHGFRLSLPWSRNQDVCGLDIGAFGGEANGNFFGVGIAGLVNGARGDMGGMHIAGIGNEAQNNAMGFQCSLIFNTAKYLYGLQMSMVMNRAWGTARGCQIGLNADAIEMFGVQIGCGNLADTLYGCQIGIGNYSDDVHGVQIGVLNYTTDLRGIQIGVLNYVGNSTIKVLPIINARF